MEMYRVIKRDGKIDEFSIKKIAEAITKAFDAQERQYHSSVIELLALKVTADFEPKITEGFVSVEDIQDSVEGGPESGRICGCGQGIHPLPAAAGKAPQYAVHGSGL